MSTLLESDKEHIRNNYDLLEKSSVEWLPNLIKNCNLDFEMGFQVDGMSYYVTKNWQVLADDTNPSKILQTFYEIINNLNNARPEKLGNIKSKNVTNKLEMFGVIKDSGLSRYQKIMIVIGICGLVAVIAGIIFTQKNF